MQHKVTKKKLKNRNPRKSDLKIEMFSKLGKKIEEKFKNTCCEQSDNEKIEQSVRLFKNSQNERNFWK